MLQKIIKTAEKLCEKFTTQKPEILVRDNDSTKLTIIFQGDIPTEEQRKQIDVALKDSFKDVLSNSMPEVGFVSWIVTTV